MEPGYKIQYLFRVRRGKLAGFRRGTSSRSGLLIIDHRRYTSKTRSLAMDLAPVVKAYRPLQKLGMNRWLEKDEKARKEITRLKHRVMDLYWDAAPEKVKASAIERYLRARYKHRMLYPLLACEASVFVWSGLSRLMLHGLSKVRPDLLLMLLAFCLLSWFVVAMAERLVKDRWTLSRSQIYNVLEYELRN